MLYYSKTHEYIRVEGPVGFIGVSDYAQQQLGNVVYVDMPQAGDEVEAGEDFGAIESVKAASDLISPVTGEVLEVNELLDADPRLVNKDAMANWIIKVSIADAAELEELMTPEQYMEYIKEAH